LDPKKAFGKTVRALRKQQGISQEILAARCELDRTHMSRLERAVQQPTLTTIFRIADELGILPSELIAQVEKQRGRGK